MKPVLDIPLDSGLKSQSPEIYLARALIVHRVIEVRDGFLCRHAVLEVELADRPVDGLRALGRAASSRNRRMLHGFWGRSPVKSDSDFRLTYLAVCRQLPISRVTRTKVQCQYFTFPVTALIGHTLRGNQIPCM
jgi:hypothetical protein